MSARSNSDSIATQLPPTPQNLKATRTSVTSICNGIRSPDDQVERYIIYRSLDNERSYQPIGTQVRGITRFTDYLGAPPHTAHYKVAASDSSYDQSPQSNSASATTRAFTDDELLTMLQEECFRYYYEGAHPDSGTTLENIPGDDRIVATGASGFGIMALIVGVDRGFITRDEGLTRMQKIVAFLEKAPRYHGVWSHFMDGHTGASLPVFSMFDNAGDLVETAFLSKACSLRGNIFTETIPPSAISTIASRNSGKRWNGIGIAARPTAMRSSGIGLPNSRGTSITASRATTKR